MITTYLLQKRNQFILIAFLFATSLFANDREVNLPSSVKTICLKCHYISSLEIDGGSSGGDLSKIMQNALQYGSFEAYINKKYETTPDIFFLYPSKFVPIMAVIEGKLFTNDIEQLISFLNTIPPNPKFIMKWYHYLIILFFITNIILHFKKRKSQ